MTDDTLEIVGYCPYCSATEFEYVFSAPNRFSSNKEELFSLTRCNNCKLVFQNPRVPEVRIGAYYNDELGYYHPQENVTKTLLGRIKASIRKNTLINHFNYSNLGKKNAFYKLLLYPFKRIYKIQLFPKFVPGGKLLEIGCSYGAHLRRLQDFGWEVTGREMSADMAKYAKESNGLSVTSGRIEDASYAEESFDAILMNMVLEHLYNPFDVLVRTTTWLRPGGELLFSIPYFEGLEYSIFKKYTYGLSLPHHITFLNKKIIREYLTKLGYTEIAFYFQFFDRDVVASAGYKNEDVPSFLYTVVSSSKFFRYCFIKPFLFIASIFHLTSRVTVHAKRRIDI